MKEKYAIKQNETIIDSNWKNPNNHLKQEEAFNISERIYWLTTHYFKKIVDNGWEILYKDNSDNHLWELIYPNSEMHGGGAPMLRTIDKESAISKYGVSIDY